MSNNTIRITKAQQAFLDRLMCAVETEGMVSGIEVDYINNDGTTATIRTVSEDGSRFVHNYQLKALMNEFPRVFVSDGELWVCAD